MNFRILFLTFPVILICFCCSLAQAQQDALVEINDGEIIIKKNDQTLVEIDSICFNYIGPSKLSIAMQSEDSIVLLLTYKNIPEFNRVESHNNHVVTLTISKLKDGFHFYADPKWAKYLTLYLKDHDEHYFGLVEQLYPDNRKSPDLRGSVVDVEVYGEGNHYFENYSSVWSAFYFSSDGYASFMNTFNRGRYYLAVNGQTKIHHETGTLDWYIFLGNHKEIYNQYYDIIGKPKYVPLWACGPIVWRDQNNGGSAEILDDVRHFSDLKIPFTGIMVDRPYSTGAHGWSNMDFSEIFENPGEWIRKLNDTYGVEFMTWVASATFSDRNFPGLIPGYFGYMDLTDSTALAEWFRRLNENQYKYGVKGHKIDRADEHFPVSEVWSDGTEESARRNKYAFLFAQVTDSMLSKAWGKDQFNYARAAYQGTQPYLSALWGGDSRASWDGMASNMANAVRVSYMGFPMWGTDVGGYLGETGQLPDDLYIRWLEWGCFNGLFEIKYDGPGGAGDDRAPWHCSEAVQDAFRTACENRMQWTPFIFSKINTSDTNGPLMKPLAMVYPNDENTYPIWDEYLFGDVVLVAPVFSAAGERSIYFPNGTWIDMNSGITIDGPASIRKEVPLAEIPVYVKANSIFTKGNIIQGNAKVWNAKEKQYLDFYYYPLAGKDAFFEFVDPANDEHVGISAHWVGDVAEISIPELPYEGKLKVFSKRKPTMVSINGKKAKTDYENGFIVIERPKAKDVEIRLSF